MDTALNQFECPPISLPCIAGGKEERMRAIGSRDEERTQAVPEGRTGQGGGN